MITAFAEHAAQHPWALLPLAAAVVLFLVNGARLAVIDARTHLLPNRIVLPWYPAAALTLGAAALLGGEPAGALRVLAAGGALFGFYLLLHLIQRRGMGMGDVKLAGILGMYLGYLSWEHLLLGTLLTFVLGGIFAAVLVASRRLSAGAAVPFGPFMVLGTGAALLLG